MKANKKQVMTWPAMLVLLCFTLFPLLIMFTTSFRSDSTGALTMENYHKFFSNFMYIKLTGSTLLMSLLVTVISLVIAYPLAYIMAKKLKGLKNVILVLTIIPFFTNQLVRVYSWLIFLQDGGILNRLFMSFGLAENGLGILYTRAAVVIGLTHAFFPYMVVTIYMALERMDDSLIEASMSLGASKFTTFKDVIFPISMPGVMSGVTIVFVPCLGSFVEPRILGGVNGTVIGTVIEDQFFQLYGWNFGAAIAFVLFAMVLIFMGAFGALGRRWETE
ncbi:MAG: ABC transporter permease [Anaerovoracaceae bacterium]|nr:ABC transporter permease [Bacillota bacterium]MDY2671096.1 ABC transporter permease [Anaerovoracaceae bacterium]